MDSGLGSFHYKRVKSLSQLSLQLCLPGEELSDLTPDDQQHPVTFLEVSCETQEDLYLRSDLGLQMVQKDLEVALTHPAHRRLLLSKGNVLFSTTEPSVSPWLHGE